MVIHSFNPKRQRKEVSEFKVSLAQKKFWAKCSIGSKGVGQPKPGNNIVKQGGHGSAPKSSRILQLLPCSTGFILKNRRGYWNN